ncbi:methionine--tRNA ligase [bacterium]|nr:methionine--tRNA ligase [bacterium]
MSREKILVTSALPYANGAIHFGHIAGAYLPADIFVRHKRMCGADVVYICGTDDHGVAITVSARQAGVSPADHVAKYHEVIRRTFDRANIRFDNFSATSRPIHHDVSREFFLDIEKAGYIEPRTTRQLYCETDDMFLADRYVTGTCPHCGFANARGDECGSCGRWLDPLELADPRCKICGTAPVVRETKNWYLLLDKIQPKLDAWLSEKTAWKDNVVNFVRGWLDKGLEARAITRDMDWGIPVPLPGAEGKVLYVWFDAPIGYISSTMEWAQNLGAPERWKDYWHAPDTRLVHFIGKDNIPFHCIVFPAMCMAKNVVRKEPIVLAADVPANEFYNLEGRQFSKSDGWYIDLDDFFSKYSADALRYTLCANMPERRDAEFTWHDFLLRNNSELADIFGNLANRVARFLERNFDGRIPDAGGLDDDDARIIGLSETLPDRVANFIDTFEFRKALFEWIELAREGNRYFDARAPWTTVKTDKAACGRHLHVCLRLLRSLAVCGFPFLPDLAARLWTMLGEMTELEKANWFEAPREALEAGKKLGEPVILVAKIEPAQIEGEVEKLKAFAADAAKKAKPPADTGKQQPKPRDEKKEARVDSEKPEDTGAVEYAPLKERVKYEDFAKLDFRTARILTAERVQKSKKLVRLSIDLGFETRQIVAGIAQHFEPDELVGRSIVVVANLEPATIMGVESNGMLLAARMGDGLVLLTADSAPGAAIS